MFGRTGTNYGIMLENFCELCGVPTSNQIWCDELCRSIQIYGLFSKDSWRKGIKPDPELWRLWVNHRHGTPIEEVEEFTW